ncbi:dihydrodipicolinate reductase, partial [mine drainage metagenome]
ALSAIGPLPPGFELSLLEAHRRGKRDRPSGTAAALLERVRSAAPEPTPDEIVSLRAGELPGIHQIWVTGPHELLRLEHLVLDRAAFADGMLWAARRLWERRQTLTARRYTLEELWLPPEAA